MYQNSKQKRRNYGRAAYLKVQSSVTEVMAISGISLWQISAGEICSHHPAFTILFILGARALIKGLATGEEKLPRLTLIQPEYSKGGNSSKTRKRSKIQNY